MVNNKPRPRRKKKEKEADQGNNDEIEYNDNKDTQSLKKIDQIQKEFDLSDLEMTEINKFIQSLPLDDDVNYVLEELVKTDKLNVRQKVAFAHAMGIFRAETNLRFCKATIIEIPTFEK